MEVKHCERHVFDHPHREIRINDPHHVSVGTRPENMKMIHASA
jgi:hypothetical protein